MQSTCSDWHDTAVGKVGEIELGLIAGFLARDRHQPRGEGFVQALSKAGEIKQDGLKLIYRGIPRQWDRVEASAADRRIQQQIRHG